MAAGESLSRIADFVYVAAAARAAEVKARHGDSAGWHLSMMIVSGSRHESIRLLMPRTYVIFGDIEGKLDPR